MDVGATQTTQAVPSPAHKAARTALIAFLLLATVVWIGIAIGANIRTPGIVGLAATVVGGVCAATLTAAIGGWIALKLAKGDHTRIDSTPAPAGADAMVAPAVMETLTAQMPVAARMVEGAAWRMPVGAAIGVTLWSVAVVLGAPGGFFDFSAVLLGGGLVGYVLARREAGAAMADAYFQRGVDTLARMQGGLSWRRTASLDARSFIQRGLLRGMADVTTAGEIAGPHGAVTLHIAPAKAKGDAAAFSGLLVQIDAPGLAADSMEALAQSHPAVIALIDQIATLPGLGKPTCAVGGGRVSLAIPETLKPRVFDAETRGSAPAVATRFTRIRQVILAMQHVAAALTPAEAPPQA